MGIEVTCTFCVSDITSHFGWSEEESTEFLNQYRKQINEAMCREGWEAIETLGHLWFPRVKLSEK